MNLFIYSLREPESGDIIYVGKTKLHEVAAEAMTRIWVERKAGLRA